MNVSRSACTLIIIFSFVYCQTPNFKEINLSIDQSSEDIVGIGDLSPTESEIISSVLFVKDFTNAVNLIKKQKELGYHGSSLKGITTRQIPGATNLYKKCSPGVVLLISLDATSMGSGSVINNYGDIITNWHVVNGSHQMLVWFYDQKITALDQLDPENYSVAEVVAADKSRDLAMVRLIDKNRKLSPLELGEEYSLSIAQDVFAIGHPEAYIWSFTYGVISQLRNNNSWSYGEDEVFNANVIQTQTPTNPGNSGGPLFDAKGKLIGINSYGVEGQGLNFAVRIGEVNEFISEVKDGGHQYNIVHENSVEEELLWSPVDRDENGMVDGHKASLNNDGYYDIAQVDDNEDGITDYIIVDTYHDGTIDIIVYDNDNNGSFEYFIMDENNDGEFDTTGIDTNGDSEPDAFFAYEG